MTYNAKNIKPFDEQDTKKAAGSPLSKIASGGLHGLGAAVGVGGIAYAGLKAINSANAD